MASNYHLYNSLTASSSIKPAMQGYVQKRFDSLLKTFSDLQAWSSSPVSQTERLLDKLYAGMQRKTTRLISIIDLEGQDSLLERLLCFREEERPDDELCLHVMTSESWGARSKDEAVSGRATCGRLTRARMKAIERRGGRGSDSSRRQETRKADQAVLLGEGGGGDDEGAREQVKRVMELALEGGRADESFSRRNR